MNQFTDVLNDVRQCQPKDRPDHLIEGIAHKIQASGNQQLGQELEDVKPQLLKALQPTG